MKKRMISLCMAFVLLFAMLPHITLSVDAAEVVESGTCGDNLTWTLDDEGTLTVSGEGDMVDYDGSVGLYYLFPWVKYRDQIEKIVVSNGVTRIGNRAFYDFISVKKLEIAGTVNSIGPYAFRGCYKLTQITLSKGIKNIEAHAFELCYGIKTISFPDGLLQIGDQAFSLCSGITEIVIPSSVLKIGVAPFYGCSSLTTIKVDSNNAYYCSDPFGVLYTKNMEDLVQAPPLLSSNYSIPDSVQAINSYAFCGCTNLLKMQIPRGVDYIEIGAFVGTCADGVFVDPENETCCSDSYGVLYSKNMDILVWAPANLNSSYSIPETVTCLRNAAFSGCKNLDTIIIPGNVSNIETAAFFACENLKTVTIHGDEVCIEYLAFSNCNNLNSITFSGNMPSFNKNVHATFDRTNNAKTVYAYYPQDNSTWNPTIFNSIPHLEWEAILMPNYDGFWLDKDGWSFANASQSFAEEPASHANDYFIPRERYDELFGRSYVDSTEGLYTEEWGGNCAGMSATAILFFLDNLDWESIDAEYSEVFYDPNDFYRTVNLHNQSQSYYPAIGNNTEVTRLIEAYQLYINAIDKSRLTDNLDNTYFSTEVEEKNTLFGKEYVVNHISASEGGTYIASMLEEFREAYDANNPLLIVLQADGFGHGIVSRTDLKPEDMGDGWWRIYVYDPNKPYINESVTSTVSGVEAEPKYTFGCNTLVDNGGDIYLELNPTLNQWRYCTSVNSNSADSYIGSSPSGELLWKNYYHDTTPENENDDEGKKNNAKIPDFFYTIDLTDLTMEDFANPHFDSTSAWIPENDLAIAIDGNTDCSIYASTGELVAIVEDGDAFVLSDAASYDAYIGQTEDGGSLGGKIYLPKDVYTVYYTSGAVQFLGSDNALSFSCEGAAELTVDITLNTLKIVAQEDGIAAVKCANVTSTDECSYVDTEGALVAGETFTIAYSDENKVEASTDSKDGEFQLYQKDTDQEEASATKVIKSNSLWWLWIVGGIAVTLLAVMIWVQRKKK